VEPASDLAPPVVAVVVVHEPGEWFDEVLAGLAAQDYANLRTLVLLAGDPGSVPDRVRASVPGAFVRGVEGNPGFGRVADQVLDLVDGDNGFFCFLHDDVALEPDAIRLLVEELYRSNAGVVGPKLLEWDDPRVLQHVGFGVDRFGEVDPIVERGEVDQEQHDAVRDVFALPSACLLVRADLFRALRGFDDAISYHGEDLDLCWRAHLSGARVVVVPSARARHRERLEERRPDLRHEVLRARHRMRAVATLTGARRLPALSVELVLLTLAELVVGPLTGSGRRGWAGMRALLGLIPRTPAILARRRAVAGGRHVPEREVAGLQLRGSARFAAYARSRDVRPAPGRDLQRTWRERAGASTAVAWIAVLVAVVVGSRHLLTGGVPTVGEFLPFDDSPARMLRAYRSGWWDHGLGGASAPPTGLALVALASVGTLFRTALLHTVAIVGLLVVGPLGIWRLSASFATNRARIASLVVYAALPLPGQLLSVGRWGALVTYAAMPWVVDGARRAAGIEPGPAARDDELVLDVPRRRRVRLVAGTGLVVAVAVAFEPSFAPVALGALAVVVLASLLAGTPARAAGRLGATGAVAVGLGVLMNLPWIAGLTGDGGWRAVIGPEPAGARGNDVIELATFDVGNLRGVLLSLALFVPVLVGPLIGRGWRYAWAVRAGTLVVAFGWLAVLDDGGSSPVALPEPGVVLVPVAIGLALGAGCAVAAFELDVRGGSFGWRQPLGVLAAVAIGIGILPGVFALTSGRWETPETTMIDLLGQLPEQPAEGDYRVLWIGDPRLVPSAGQRYAPGIAYALTRNRDLDVDETWPARPSDGDDAVVGALDAIASGSTARAGRLLAPFAVRYIVIPVADGAVSRTQEPLPVPGGLVDALGDQLDMAELYSPPNVIVFENEAWIPMRSVLTGEAAAASRVAGASALAQADVAGAAPVMLGADHLDGATADLPAGTLHLAVPYDDRWVLEVDGREVPSRPAFGLTTAFDVETAGAGTLRYESSGVRPVLLALQAVLWLAVALVAADVALPQRGRRRRGLAAAAGPVLRIDGPAPSTWAPPAQAGAGSGDETVPLHAVAPGDAEVDR